jgi:hypothetical protein
VFNEGMGFDFLWSLAILLCVSLVLRQTTQGRASWEIRRVQGLDAIDEAIGRATEMNRPVMYLPGYTGLSSPQTLASMTVLSEVAKKTAQYDCRLIVPVQYPEIHSVLHEVIRQSYIETGHPDRFRSDDVMWFSNHYFGYAIGVIGIMNKEQIGANIMVGSFAFDALMYGEAASQVGAIQIGGTDGPITDFVVTCDYTLIGEEMYAAAAYLSKDPKRISSIVVEDWFKYVVTAVVILGSLLNTIGKVDVLSRILDW